MTDGEEIQARADDRGCMGIDCDGKLTYSKHDADNGLWYFRCGKCDKITKLFRESDGRVAMSFPVSLKIADAVLPDAADKHIAELEARLAKLLDPKRKTYWNDRGHLLSYWGDPPGRTTVCCELYGKWYTLYVITPDGTVAPLDYTHLPDGPLYEEGDDDIPMYMKAGAPRYKAYSDHVPHPLAVLEYVDKQGWDLCDTAEELITERWFRHVQDLGTEEIMTLVPPTRTKCWTPVEVGQILRITSKTVIKLIEDKELPGFKVGRQWRVSASALDDYLTRSFHNAQAQEAQTEEEAGRGDQGDDGR